MPGLLVSIKGELYNQSSDRAMWPCLSVQMDSLCEGTTATMPHSLSISRCQKPSVIDRGGGDGHA